MLTGSDQELYCFLISMHDMIHDSCDELGDESFNFSVEISRSTSVKCEYKLQMCNIRSLQTPITDTI
jgi:hypothetical protein